jgi:hypothetical protein
MSVSSLFEDFPSCEPSSFFETLRERVDRDGAESVRSEALLRLEAGSLPMALGVPLFICLDTEPVLPDLRRLLHRPSSSAETRLIAFVVLANTGSDAAGELASLDRDVRKELIANSKELKHAMAVIGSKGGPFQALMEADPDDEEAALKHFATIIETFLASPEADLLEGREEACWWIGEFLRLSHSHGLGSPVSMTVADVEEVLSELMPREVTIASEEEAKAAIPALRAFFTWVARVGKPGERASILRALTALEPRFPSMMMDESRFGPAKGFVMAGLNAGFDMSTQAGVEAFQPQWDREHPPDGNRAPAQSLPATKKKPDAAKKRKAKMAKASRKKNRRKK